MRQLNLKVVTETTTAFAVIAYLICVAFRPVFPGWAMYTSEMWYASFPGFAWTLGGVLLGLVEVALYAYFGAALFVTLYNFFARRSAPARL